MSWQRPGGHRRIITRPFASQGGTVEDTILVDKIRQMEPTGSSVERRFQPFRSGPSGSGNVGRSGHCSSARHNSGSRPFNTGKSLYRLRNWIT